MAGYDCSYVRRRSPFVHGHRCDYVVSNDLRTVCYRASSVSPSAPSNRKSRKSPNGLISSVKDVNYALEPCDDFSVGYRMRDKSPHRSDLHSLQLKYKHSFYGYEESSPSPYRDDVSNEAFEDYFSSIPTDCLLDKIEHRRFIDVLDSELINYDEGATPATALTQMQPTSSPVSDFRGDVFDVGSESQDAILKFVEPHMNYGEGDPIVTALDISNLSSRDNVSTKQPKSPVSSLFGAIRGLRRRIRDKSLDRSVKREASPVTTHRVDSPLRAHLRTRSASLTPTLEKSLATRPSDHLVVTPITDIESSVADLFKGVVGQTPPDHKHLMNECESLKPVIKIPRSILKKILPKTSDDDGEASTFDIDKIREDEQVTDTELVKTTLKNTLKDYVMPVDVDGNSRRLMQCHQRRNRFAPHHMVTNYQFKTSDSDIGYVDRLQSFKDASPHTQCLMPLVNMKDVDDIDTRAQNYAPTVTSGIVLADDSVRVPSREMHSPHAAMQERQKVLPTNIELSSIITSMFIPSNADEFSRQMTTVCGAVEGGAFDELYSDEEEERSLAYDEGVVIDDGNAQPDSVEDTREDPVASLTDKATGGKLMTIHHGQDQTAVAPKGAETFKGSLTIPSRMPDRVHETPINQEFYMHDKVPSRGATIPLLEDKVSMDTVTINDKIPAIHAMSAEFETPSLIWPTAAGEVNTREEELSMDLLKSKSLSIGHAFQHTEASIAMDAEWNDAALQDDLINATLTTDKSALYLNTNAALTGHIDLPALRVDTSSIDGTINIRLQRTMSYKDLLQEPPLVESENVSNLQHTFSSSTQTNDMGIGEPAAVYYRMYTDNLEPAKPSIASHGEDIDGKHSSKKSAVDVTASMRQGEELADVVSFQPKEISRRSSLAASDAPLIVPSAGMLRENSGADTLHSTADATESVLDHNQLLPPSALPSRRVSDLISQGISDAPSLDESVSALPSADVSSSKNETALSTMSITSHGMHMIDSMDKHLMPPSNEVWNECEVEQATRIPLPDESVLSPQVAIDPSHVAVIPDNIPLSSSNEDNLYVGRPHPSTSTPERLEGAPPEEDSLIPNADDNTVLDVPIKEESNTAIGDVIPSHDGPVHADITAEIYEGKENQQSHKDTLSPAPSRDPIKKHESASELKDVTEKKKKKKKKSKDDKDKEKSGKKKSKGDKKKHIDDEHANRPRPFRNLVDKQLKDGFTGTVYIVTSKKKATSSLCTVKFDYDADRLIFETPANIFDIDGSKVVAEEIPTLPGAPVLLKLTVKGNTSSVIVIQSTCERNLNVLGGTVGWANACTKKEMVENMDFGKDFMEKPKSRSASKIQDRIMSSDSRFAKDSDEKGHEDKKRRNIKSATATTNVQPLQKNKSSTDRLPKEHASFTHSNQGMLNYVI
ncbi:hypothetical protein X943_000868 [Babesia divergens]|uniref:Uncharacterized protein n=1 Tax=Babesia divergens TaxID=32595 RepID=A0AAD9G6M4_BABDI|nr:hypothetical protein X943_000868 [Babesia divergens]